MWTQGRLKQQTVEIRVDQRLSLCSEQIFLSVFESLKNISLIFHEEEMEEFAKVEKPGSLFSFVNLSPLHFFKFQPLVTSKRPIF
jgi:hypothetical protein